MADLDSPKLRREAINLVKARGCVWCGEKRLPCMDLHHLNPAEKKHNIAALVNSGTMPVLQDELKKCVPLCSNCHRVVHSILRNPKRHKRGTSPWKDFEDFWINEAPYMDEHERRHMARDFPLDSESH